MLFDTLCTNQGAQAINGSGQGCLESDEVFIVEDARAQDWQIREIANAPRPVRAINVVPLHEIAVFHSCVNTRADIYILPFKCNSPAIQPVAFGSGKPDPEIDPDQG